MMEFQPKMEIKKSLASQKLFTDWLLNGLPLEPSTLSATAELGKCLEPVSAGDPVRPCPFFAATRDAELGPTWAATFLSDLPDAREREMFETNLESLQTGQSRIVITGQQPGSMGAPLYSLFKISTAVALARMRTRAGMPTVPVFWSGDDDDDLVESMKPRSWDPVSNELFANPNSLAAFGEGTRPKPCVGNLRASSWSYQVSQWLNGDKLQPMLPVLGQELALIWAEACAEEWTWAKLNRRFLLKVFRGSGLIVVSGNDPFLHRSAAPLYEIILPVRNKLATAARVRGEALSKLGYPVPITDRSLHRNLFGAEGRGRRFLDDVDSDVDHGILRPGVMLRSPVQDWLFEPAGVIVGPGELAYLRQLDPVYQQLGISRSPLIPRMFGWIVPEGFDLSFLNAPSNGLIPSSPNVGQLAEAAASVAEAEVKRLLVQDLGTDPDRAASLAAGRSRRWRKSLEAMFRDEARRQQTESVPGEPVWVFPHGERQERVLSSLTVAALWGDRLIAGMIDGAGEYLELGKTGLWKEFVAQVPSPKGAQS